MYKAATKPIEEVVCDVGDLKDGEMKEVEIAKKKILLVRDQGEFYALGGTCTHYAAPLSKGVLCNGHIRCPWHGACFDVRTGDIEDFPGLDSLPKYDVSVTDGKVKIRTDLMQLAVNRREKPMVAGSTKNKPTVLIIGGGPAGLECAETLRQENFKGKVIIATRERHLPYDRPKLSKFLNVKAEKIALRNSLFFHEHGIEVLLNKEAFRVDTRSHSVSFTDGSTVNYDKLLLAPGTQPRKLANVPGCDLKNITTLRTVDDANFIYTNAQNKNVVLIGTSFIGVEVAAALAGKAASVTIVDLVEAPFQLALGKEVGQGVKKLLEENGIKFYFKNSSKEFVGKDGMLTGVVLQDGTKLEADLCVLGIGVVPSTDFLKDSGLDITDRGFIKVDKHMKTSVDNVYAAGDVTQFPLIMVGEMAANVQHWQMAHQQGHIAGLNMANKATPIHSIPYFWTFIFGKSIRYTGYGFGYDDLKMHGDPDELKFVVYYTKGDKVVAVASMNYDPIVSQAAEMFYSGKHITKQEIMNSPTDWIKRL